MEEFGTTLERKEKVLRITRDYGTVTINGLRFTCSSSGEAKRAILCIQESLKDTDINFSIGARAL